MPIELVTFDLDDTLWDVKPTLLRAEAKQNEWLAEHRPGCVEQYDHDGLFEFKKSVWKRFPEFAHNISKMREQFLIELQLAAGYSDDEAVNGAQIAFGVFLTERHKVSLYEGALQVLESLATRYRLGAITNGNADVYKTDAAEYFDFAILAEDVGQAKPAPEAFLAALERARVEPNEAVHVGDHWDSVNVLDGLQDWQALVQARPAEGMNRGSVRLVVRRLEHKGDPQPFAYLFVVPRATEGEVEILQHIYAAQKDEGPIVGEADAVELDLTRCHLLLESLAEPTAFLNGGTVSDSLQP